MFSTLLRTGRPCLLFAGLLSSRALAAAELVPLEINREQLVEMAVLAEVAPPVLANPPYRISPDGEILVLPGTGSITYNVRTGDSAVALAGDHVEPGVSVVNLGAKKERDSAESTALNVLTGVGNRARILDGEAKGMEGTVIGKHGGVEHVMLDFPDRAYQQLAIGDRIQIRALGLGMEARNVTGIKLMNMDPRLVDALNRHGMGVNRAGRLVVPVACRIPARVMGSGLGQPHVYSGDHDIQLFDPATVAEYGLERLRMGDIVAITDADHSYGRVYRGGAITIGIIAHGASKVAGHGPGVVTLITSPTGNIELVDDPQMNLGRLLKVR